jgi:hypothetical protein
MGAIGDLRSLTMYQAANSMARMAEQGGGAGGAMGMGMGAGFGMMLPGMLQSAMQGAASAPRPGAPAALAAGAGAAAMNFDALAPAAPDPKALVRTVAQSAGWQVHEQGDQWQIVVPVGPLRKQTVNVNFAARDPDGHALIAYSSTCGPALPQHAMTLLKFNQQLVHGAFSVQTTSAGDMVVVQANQLADTTDTLEVTRTLTAVAWQADKAEEKMTGGDTH